MSIGKLVTVLVALTGAVTVPEALRANELAARPDGCATLGELVRTEVLRGAWFGSRTAAFTARVEPEGGAQSCARTVRTVSAAFTGALARMNIHVTWSPFPGAAGDYCLSHYLDQCYPERHPFMGGSDSWNSAFVADTWQAVQFALVPTLRAGAGADHSRFDATMLRAVLRYSIAREAAGPWLHYYLRAQRARGEDAPN